MQQCFLNSVQNFKANGQAALVIALGEHDNLWILARSACSFYSCYIFSFFIIFTKKYPCRRPFGVLDIGISASASALTSALASALQKVYFVFEVFIFTFRSFLWSKTSIVKSFSSTLPSLSGRFSCCLEQLFFRQPIMVCFRRKELDSNRYLRSFKNTQVWNLQFACQ